MRRALLAALLVAGCVGAQGTMRLGGAFTEAATQADIDAFSEDMRRFGRGVDVAILESVPPQFSVRGLDADKCDDARALAASRPYVARVGECLQESR